MEQIKINDFLENAFLDDRLDLMEKAINFGANPNHQADFALNGSIERMSLMHACLLPRYVKNIGQVYDQFALEKIDLLLRKGAKPNIICGTIGTLLHCVTNDKDDYRALNLLRQGVDPFIKDRDGYSFFEYSIYNSKDLIIDTIKRDFPEYKTHECEALKETLNDHTTRRLVKLLKYIDPTSSNSEGRNFIELCIMRDNYQAFAVAVSTNPEALRSGMYISLFYNNEKTMRVACKIVNSREDSHEFFDEFLKTTSYLQNRDNARNVLMEYIGTSNL